MDLEKHFDSFLLSLKNDALQGSRDFANNMSIKDSRFKNAGQYFGFISGKIRDAIKKNDAQDYFKFLYTYQEGCIRLYEKMVRNCTPETSTKDQKMNTVLDKGYRWFKFSDITIDFKIEGQATPFYRWIPRYSKRFLDTDLPVVSTDEMLAMMNFNFDVESARKLVELKKKKGPEHVIMTGMQGNGKVECWSIEHINKDHVREWTLAL